ncbi:MAG: biotin transporter BioY [Propionibacteriaceae bacterium]|jgi:biotin transport system substrate-specific component|nr:biotin transporter BioY [Propionibacteriaceae bacterium]
MTRSRSPLQDTAFIAVFAALIAALSLAPAVPVGIGVPITLQTLGVAVTAAVLGPLRSCLATLLYIVVGLAGLPVFAGGVAGFQIFSRPSIGYLLSFPLAALVIGHAARRFARSRRQLPAKLTAAALLGSVVIIHPAGIVGMSVNAHITLGKAFVTDMLYWPGDLVKSTLAGLVAAVVHRTFPALLARPSALKAAPAQ